MRKPVLSLLLMFALGAAAQVSAPAPDQAVPRPAGAAVPITSPMLMQLRQAAVNLRVDLARLRFSKWKDKDNSREQAQANAESLDRNLELALPGMLQEAQSQPGSMAAQFKLYRNISALYDVLNGLAGTAAAYAPQEEFAALRNDLSAFDQIRRQMGDQLQTLAQEKDNQLARLAAEARTASPSQTPKKVVIDDSAPAKPVKHSKTTKKKSTPKSEPHER